MPSNRFQQNEKTPLQFVVGLNQVDKMVFNGWDERLNLPTKEAEQQIERRSKDIVDKLSKYSRLTTSHMEHYSALKRYRLENLLSKIIRYTHAGFRLDDVEPQPWWDLAEAEVREYVVREQKKRKHVQGKPQTSKELFFEELRKLLPSDALQQVEREYKKVRQTPPSVAILGKAGVGKTTTVNGLFNAKWKTSHTFVGTTNLQSKEFQLLTGGTLTMIDLPGYGRSLAEDRQYENMYREAIGHCDLILLIVQADARDLADDQEMIAKISEWLAKINP